MRSMQIVAWGEPLGARDYPDPTPKGSEVIVRVHACGVCHTDLHLWQGYYDLGEGQRAYVKDRGIELPFTMGHEIVGEVAAIGPGARDAGLREGDRRLVYPWIGCGECAVCRRGDELLCVRPRVIGTWKDGGYSTHVTVPHPRYLVDYGPLQPELACTYACSGITGWSALKKLGRLHEGESVLMIGAGGVGLNALHLAPNLIKNPIIVADADPAKRATAEKAGAAWTLDNRSPDALATLRERTGGGVAGVIDFVGRPATARFGFDALAKGGRLVLVGLYGGSLSLPLPPIPQRMLSVQGTFVGTLEDLREIVGLAREGKVAPLPIETRPMDGATAALQDLAEGKVRGRIVLQ